MGLLDEFGDLFGGQSKPVEESLDKLSVSALRSKLRDAEAEVARLKANMASVEALKKRAQNNIDRSWNRALRRVVEKVEDLTLAQIEKVEDQKRHVRHGDDFGWE